MMLIEDYVLLFFKTAVYTGLIICILGWPRMWQDKKCRVFLCLIPISLYAAELIYEGRPLEAFGVRFILLLVFAAYMYRKSFLIILSTVLLALISTDIIQVVSAIISYPLLFIKSAALDYRLVLLAGLFIEICLAAVSGRLLLSRLEDILYQRSRKTKLGICLIASFLEGIYLLFKLQNYKEENTLLYETLFLVILFCNLILFFFIWDKKKEQERMLELSSYAHRTREVLPVIERAIKSHGLLTYGKETEALISEICSVCESDRQSTQQEANEFKTFAPTGSILLDEQLNRYLEEAAKKNIHLDIMVSAPVDKLLKNKSIEVKALLQISGDLYRNASQAVETAGNNGYILICFGYGADNIYEIAVYDSGMPFPEYVLKHLGKRGVTVNGTGHGIADILEVLKKANGSLLIKQNLGDGNIFTKGVSLLFDGKGRLEID